ncbi:MAG: Flagellar motor switch protein FliG [Steroidobacteraceae bacterium]|nr:Flagellar motor switch protein FliG [Steroidobacteraceae bacterium]
MSDKASARRSGIDQAAILLLTLGEQEAAEVLKHMSAKDVQRVGTAMAALDGVTRDEVSEVLMHFTSTIETQTSLGVGTDEFLRKVLVSALGDDRAANVMDRILGGRSSRGLEAMKWMDPRAVAEMMRSEHPQIVAIVLAYLEPDHAAAVLAQLPEDARPDILMRIATLDGIQPSALDELDKVMEKQFAGNSSSKASVFGGPKVSANIINSLDSGKEAVIMERIRQVDEALGAKIQDLIFTFDDLTSIDDRGMQELLRQIPGDRLLLALKACEPQLKDKVFRNMSQRAAEMLKDDMESKGPVRVSEVDAAQKEILAIAKRLSDAGTIAIGGKGGEAYV